MMEADERYIEPVPNPLDVIDVYDELIREREATGKDPHARRSVTLDSAPDLLDEVLEIAADLDWGRRDEDDCLILEDYDALDLALRAYRQRLSVELAAEDEETDEDDEG